MQRRCGTQNIACTLLMYVVSLALRNVPYRPACVCMLLHVSALDSIPRTTLQVWYTHANNGVCCHGQHDSGIEISGHIVAGINVLMYTHNFHEKQVHGAGPKEKQSRHV